MYRKVEEIINLSGLPMNFIVCKINSAQNAFAAIDKYGNRYIKYDDEFMTRLNTDTSAIESMIVLAHEIGHHIFFHAIVSSIDDIPMNFQQIKPADSETHDTKIDEDQLQEFYIRRRKQELEADRFAGFIMERKGVKFDIVANFYEKLARRYKIKDDSTHPSFDKRIDALREGYNDADSALKNQPIDLLKFDKQGTIITFKNTTKLDRDILITKVVDAIRFSAVQLSNGKYKLGVGVGGYPMSPLDSIELKSLKEYLGRDINLNMDIIDDDKDYFELLRSAFSIQNAANAYNASYSGLHIRGGYINLILFTPGKPLKVAYNSRFEDSQISYDQIKLLFRDVFQPQVQKLFDSYSK